MTIFDFNGRSFPMYHICKRAESGGTFRVTGCQKEIKAGDVFMNILGLDVNGNIRFLKVEKISHRDHRGKFKNPNDAINSFFESQCTEFISDELTAQIKNKDVKIIGGFN